MVRSGEGIFCRSARIACPKTGHTAVMGRRKPKKQIEELMEGCASANECTGLLQKISSDPEEIALFHKLFNDGED